jgi:5,5'-dehydrodivanillate O-demethylase
LIFVAQGEIADRTKERLGDTDRGIILYRKLLKEQIEIVADGGQPMNVFRDPERNRSITLPEVKQYYAQGRGKDGTYKSGAATARSSIGSFPIAAQLEELFVKEAEAKSVRSV